MPPGDIDQMHLTAPVQAKAQHAVKPIWIALGVFGAIAALAGVLIAIQAISRQLAGSGQELQALRALGASPAMTLADSLIGILGAMLAGVLIAVALAIALSPLAPLGPVRPVYPHPGVAVDWTVIGLGAIVFGGGLSLVALLLAVRAAPERTARRSLSELPQTQAAYRFAASAGLAPPAAMGIGFALDPRGPRGGGTPAGRGGGSGVPVRSAIVGTALAVVAVVATLTFGSGLHTLASTPALYGWNWSYMLNSSNDVPPQALALLARDPDVAAWSGADNTQITLDGQVVPMYTEDVTATVTPPILSGHGIEAPDQIVVGSATLAQLGKRIGDTVMASSGAPQDAPLYVPPTPVIIVGTATMPAVGFSSTVSDHPSMGIGALTANELPPLAFQQALLSPDPTLNGPSTVFVRLRPGVPAAAGRADLERIATAGDAALAAAPNGDGQGQEVSIDGVLRPAEIVNFRTIGATPDLLAGGLALGALVALGLTLAASVRRRRRELGVLKTLGFTARQVATTVAWQASVAAAVGILVGVPLGIALGRQLWIAFARSIDAVPEATVPALALVAVGAGALAFANLVATLPARSAARTSAAEALRPE